MTETLEESRETNRRLNRRLGDMEHQLHSMVSSAQNIAREALIRASESQDRAQTWLKSWHHQCERSYANETLIGRLILALVAISIWAITATILWLKRS